MSTIPALGERAYTLTTTLAGVSFADAVENVRTALAAEGFGVLTEINIQGVLKKKLDADTRPYLILGACNPPLAHQALQAEPGIGALLPCNVVVTTDDEDNAVVAAIDPVAMFGVVGRADVESVAVEVRQRLRRALDAL